MAEPEELIIEGAHFATRVARDAWRRYAPPGPRSSVSLASVRVRLELFLTALFAVRYYRGRRSAAIPDMAVAAGSRPLAGDDEDTLAPARMAHACIFPPSLPGEGREEETMALYQLLAVQQASRLVRGTAQVFAGIGVAEVRDWFLLAEAVASIAGLRRSSWPCGHAARRAGAARSRGGPGAAQAARHGSQSKRWSDHALAADPAADVSRTSRNERAGGVSRLGSGPGRTSACTGPVSRDHTCGVLGPDAGLLRR